MSDPLSWAVPLAAALLGLSVFLTLGRLIKGPSLPDRVVALDMMTVSIVAICGLAAIHFEVAAFLDVAMALALVGFLATVALARFAERGRGYGDKLRDHLEAEVEAGRVKRKEAGDE